MKAKTQNRIQCCWSEVIDGKHLNQCQSYETLKDLDNIQNRWFCKIHMKKVENIRFEMYKKMKLKYNDTINKVVFIKWLYNYGLLPQDVEYIVDMIRKDMFL